MCKCQEKSNNIAPPITSFPGGSLRSGSPLTGFNPFGPPPSVVGSFPSQGVAQFVSQLSASSQAYQPSLSAEHTLGTQYEMAVNSGANPADVTGAVSKRSISRRLVGGELVSNRTAFIEPVKVLPVRSRR